MTGTQIDLDKSLADIRILYVDGTYTVSSKVELSGRGISARATSGLYEVSRAALRKLQKEFNVVCDF